MTLPNILSAIQENAKYMDSIQGKLDQFNNSVQTMWMNTLNSDVIKFIVDVGNGLVKIVDKLGLVNTLVGGIVAKFAFSGKSGFGNFFTGKILDVPNQIAEKLQGSKLFGQLFNINNAQQAAEAIKEVGDVADDAGGKIIQFADFTDAQSAASKGAAVSNTANAATETTVGTAAATASVGVKLLNAALGFGIGLLASFTVTAVIKGLDAIIHHAENLREEVNELTDTYKTAKQEFSDNLESLTISSDDSKYKTLQQEFEILTKGVNKYGENVSLTSDEYERYKAICEKIVEIQPSIAEGYDNATQAIGNNAGVLSQLIELQKIEARQNAQEFVKDDNLEKIAENQINSYKQATEKVRSYVSGGNGIGISNILYEAFDWNDSGSKDYGDKTSNGDDLAKKIMEIIGIENIDDKLKQYYNKTGYFQYSQWIQDYADQIANNKLKISDAITDSSDSDAIKEWANNYKSAQKDLDSAKDGFVDSLLQVPASLENYDKLSNGGKSFITEWIKNNDAFKIDENTTESAILDMKSSIREMIDALDIEKEIVTADGKTHKVSMQDILDRIFEIDPSSIDFSKYKEKIKQLMDMLWEVIGGENNQFGITDKQALAIKFGFNFTFDDSNGPGNTQEAKLKKDLARVTGEQEKDIQSWIDSLPAATVQRLMTIDYTAVASGSLDRGQVLEKSNGSAVANENLAQTYSNLKNEVDSFNEKVKISSEVIVDNTELTDAQYTAIKDLIGEEEEFSDVMDKNNTKVVKNSKLLRELVNRKQEDKKATIAAAKANAQLQYSKAVKQIQSLNNNIAKEIKIKGLDSKATALFTATTLKNVSILREQLTSLKQTIQEYARLEISLSDAAKAYTDYQDAKNRDAELTYDEGMLEALKSIDEGILSGAVGTEEFEYAVKMIVPEDVYKAQQEISDIDGMVRSIHDYCDSNPLFANWFTVKDDGSFDITVDNVRAFIQDMKDAGAITGDAGNFEFTQEVDSLDALVEMLNASTDGAGVTKEAVLAMLSATEDFDGTWSNVITDLMTTPMDREINKATDALDEATKAQEDYLKACEKGEKDFNIEIWNGLTTNVNNASSALETATQNAIDNAGQYAYLQTLMNAYSGTVSLTKDEVENLARSLGLVDENGNVTLAVNDDGTIKQTEDNMNILLDKKENLKEPSQMDIQLQYDQLNKELDDLITKKKELEQLKVATPQAQIQAGFKDSSSIDDAITELNKQITEKQANVKSIGLTYSITETTEEKSSSLAAKYENWETNGLKITATLNTEQVEAAGKKIDEAVPDETKTTVKAEEDGTVTTTQKQVDDLVDATEAGAEGTATFTSNASQVTSEVQTYHQEIDDIPTEKTTTLKVNKEVHTDYSFGFGKSEGKESEATGNADFSGKTHVFGNAFSDGNIGLPKAENNSLVGELGTEILVRDGRYYTIGENGAEFMNLKRGDIIFNHLQAEQLLKHGYTNSRGKVNGSLSFAQGNAHYGTVSYSPSDLDTSFKNGLESINFDDIANNISDAVDDISDAVDNVNDAADEVEDDAKQTIDFIEYKLQEIENLIANVTGRIENHLDNTTQTSNKNSLYDELVSAEKDKASTYFSAAITYNKKAAQLLNEVPAQYREMAKNGAIAITDFVGESETKIAEAIENYREWATKADDAENSYLETIAEISAKRLEQLQDIADDFENITGLTDRHSDIIQSQVDFLEESGERLSANFYNELIKTSDNKIKDLENQRKEMQSILDKSVQSGDVKVGSDDWYEMVNAIYDVDDAIIECKIDIEEFQNGINDLYWDNLDKFINQIDSVESELSNLYDLVSDDDKVVDEFGNWTTDGITALGLLAQQLETANFKVEQYGEAINQLNKDYADGKYSTDEYNEKLAELKESQWDSINAMESAKKALLDLNKVRVESAKKVIQDEIDAYSELINKKKEELNLQKDAHDFQKEVEERQKNIANLEKQLAAMSGDTSASANAKRKQLEEELYKAREELEELYYQHSMEKQGEALDDQLSDFEKNKQDEMDALDESLKNEEAIIQGSYDTIAANTDSLANNLTEIANKYGISLSDAITEPWQNGANAIGIYKDQLDVSFSAFTEQLNLMKQQLIDLQIEADKTAKSIIDATTGKEKDTTDAKYEPPKPVSKPPAAKPKPKEKAIVVGGKINAGGAKIYSYAGGQGYGQYFSSDPVYTVLSEQNGWLKVRYHKLGDGVTGWFKKGDVKAYAKGSKGVDKDRLALVDELGEEIQLVPNSSGRLDYVKKGTGILNASMTEKLMEWGQLDPRKVLENSAPTVSAPHITNNEFNIDMSFGSLVHVDSVSQDTLPELQKMVRSEFDNCMKGLNSSLRKYSR